MNTQPTFDFHPYLIYQSDSTIERLTKLRDFLVKLSEVQPTRFNYNFYLYAAPLNETLDPESSVVELTYRNIVQPQVRWELKEKSDTISDDTKTEKALTLTDQTHSCGTCACVAGWANILSRVPIKKDPNSCGFTEELACQTLGIDFYETDDNAFLFMGDPGYGLERLDLRYATVQDAVQRLNILIDKYSKEEHE